VTVIKKRLLLYVNAMKTIIDTNYEKEMVFYDDGDWYSRHHCRNITDEELIEWVIEITEPKE
jgi:hypothetical protein